ncbi:DUF1824 family protein [Cyanobium sp. HWJ4-Hawea]|uniref:DUF1824 family protein n=1 Tax=Cyanobium sp. HWJ4-Hawea TaxID=2823713 RepID=UPI0020CD1B69|nr:DUF1824 family protein [Cyanobium sp. HWJ4-Hawea]MCP9810269.1 DUF1824 family protein [Cyanobium sp. HWJ4-Hawea]
MANSTSLTLADLRVLRTAPELGTGQAEQLALELAAVMARCAWFTAGIMAPSADLAVNALRAMEQRLGWTRLEPAPAESAKPAPGGPVFLKANQNTGSYSIRPEDGLGEGILISGQDSSEPDGDATWGPLPLNFFA